MDVILKLLGDLWQFVLDHADVAIPVATAGIGFLSWLMPKVWRSLRRPSTQLLLTDNFPFNCIPPGSNDLVQQVLDSAQDKADPLADFNIPYQSRQTDRDVQRELEQRLDRKHWLLILGHKGLGKTRETAELARIYSQEGWVVLRLKNNESGLLTEPASFPVAQIGMSQPKLLFVLDNLNQAMFLGRRRSTPSDTSSDQNRQRLAQASDRPLHDRLLKTLQFYENACGTDRVRVIATARNEPGELEKLELDDHPDFWNRFEQYELRPPSNQAIVNLLADRTTQAQIDTNPAEFDSFARSNDGTFRNIVENLIKVKNRGLSLTSQTFEHSLDGTWEERYHTAIETYPMAPLIYDAVDLLRQMGIALHDFTVLPTAQLLMTANYWQRLKRKRKLKQSLDYLIQNERILQPRDGQIEAKGNQVDANSYIPALSNLLLNWADRHPQSMLESLFGFGLEASDRQYHREAFTSFDRLLKLTPDLDFLWIERGYSLSKLERHQEAFESFDRAVALKPDLHEAWYNRGVALSDLGRKQEAIDSHDKAIEIKPDLHEAWCNRGNALSGLERHQEAIASYDKAIQCEPDYHEAWNNRGIALSRLGQKQEAINSYDKSIELKPIQYQAWYNRGITLAELGQAQTAIDSYDKAIEIKPDYHEAWNDRGVALLELGQKQAAIDSFDKVVEIKSSSHKAWNSRGVALFDLGQKQEAIDSYDKAIQCRPDYYQAWFNRGLALSDLGCTQEAIYSCDKAIEIKPDFHEAWYVRGLILSTSGRTQEAIDSYDKAIEIKPDLHEAWCIRGIALSVLGRYQEALASYDKVLEIKPDDIHVWYAKACCWGLQGEIEQAVVHLQRAIQLNPDYREDAKTDPAFNVIRSDDRFQSLIGDGE